MEKKIMKICELCEGYKYQGPRFKYLGPFSGEEFREKYLLPWLDTLGIQEESIIDFTGTEVYSPSFLEGSFGGTIRLAKTKEEAEINRKKLQQVNFINMDPDWKVKLEGYIKNAKHNPKNNDVK
ncbi:MAG: STAS-like domain-containing protein [Treponema sp.]|jgi:hypothetical protein|nr:STAS-like domain-containing protein [Treponema sp.]